MATQQFDYQGLKVCLGKGAPTQDDRNLKLRDFLEPDLPEPPEELSWLGGKSAWGMMLNDTLGDCTIAAPGHAMQTMTLAVGPQEITIPDWQIEKYYEYWDGYVAGDPSTDQGGDMLAIAKRWRKTNFAGFQLKAFVTPDLGNQTHLKQSVAMFGGLNIGLALPLTAQGQKEWIVVGDGKTGDSAPGSWGGHDVWVAGYNATGPVVISWGMVIQMTWEFWNTYVDEAYTLLVGYWIRKGTAPSGFKMGALEAALQAVAG